jgi:prevent-host-death family protein
MIDVNTHEAKTSLSHLLALVESGKEKVRICRNGKPVALLIPITADVTDPLTRHPELAGVVFHENPTAALDADDWPAEER